ncbi:hypothetical protein [Paenisporosarcina antarctica]|nr:hypothetical protein [Paenisporosarcina antarctica]
MRSDGYHQINWESYQKIKLPISPHVTNHQAPGRKQRGQRGGISRT